MSQSKSQIFVCEFINLTTCYLFQLKPVEAEFLAVNTNAALSTFEKVSENIGMELQCMGSIC